MAEAAALRATLDKLKLLPVCLTSMTLCVLLAVFLFGVPFRGSVLALYALSAVGVPLRGSLLLLYGSSLFYLASVASLGLLISALSTTQQQAILGAFLFLVPAMLRSGFATLIENLPDWLQPLTVVNRLRYFLVIVKGVFLKDGPPIEVLRQTWPLCVIAAVALGTTALLFRRRLE